MIYSRKKRRNFIKKMNGIIFGSFWNVKYYNSELGP